MAGHRSKQRFEFNAIRLDEASTEDLYRQLENQIRTVISGRLLPAGSRVPSSRSLSRMLGVSRNTVLTAYEQLISEGYLESKTGSGTTVAALLPEAFEFGTRPLTSVNRNTAAHSLSATGRQLADFATWMPDAPEVARPFRPHLSAIDEFPIAVWNRLTNEQARWSSRQLGHCDPQGFPPLRESIAEYMGVSRGVACTADQVVITAGAQQGLSLIMQLLLDAGDAVWVEEPGNTPANQLLSLSDFPLVHVPVDAEGIDLNQVPKGAASPRLIYVTPGGQWPLAMTMSLKRRMQLLALAEQHQAWVIEDDYNGEFRYTGRPHPALCSLDQSGRTIYMGTFSKMLFPAIRLGFLIVPPQLARTFAYGRWLRDRGSPPLPQMVLHRFIEAGHFLTHIRQMRALYRERQQYLYDALQRQFGDLITVDQPESGMHLVVHGATQKIESQLIVAARRANVEFHPVSMYSERPQKHQGLILGFAAFDEASSRKALRAWSRQMDAS